jgi:hypothetical protein
MEITKVKMPGHSGRSREYNLLQQKQQSNFMHKAETFHMVLYTMHSFHIVYSITFI